MLGVYRLITRQFPTCKLSPAILARLIMQSNKIRDPRFIRANQKISVNVPLNQTPTLKSIAKKFKIDLQKLHKLNPAVQQYTTSLPHNAEIRLPKDQT